MSEQDELLLTDEEIDKAVRVGWLPYSQEGLTQAKLSYVRDRAIAKAQLAKAKQHYGEKLYNQTMEAKKSGWDDCLKFYEQKRLDRPELRKKIDQILMDYKESLLFVVEATDQILAFFPDIEKAKKQERERMWDILESYRTGDNEKGLLFTIPHRDWIAFRQALKGKTDDKAYDIE